MADVNVGPGQFVGGSAELHRRTHDWLENEPLGKPVATSKVRQDGSVSFSKVAVGSYWVLQPAKDGDPVAVRIDSTGIEGATVPEPAPPRAKKASKKAKAKKSTKKAPAKRSRPRSKVTVHTGARSTATVKARAKK